MEAAAETYLTPKSAGDQDCRPYVKSVQVPESIKRRMPSKHYVYKVVVNWTSGKKIIIYRKYSLFFDFVIKLNEMLQELSPEIQKDVQLPELPGRVLFGRTEVHQVAEKRRRKIEEFCQKLIELPEEVSHHSLVLGFFNTWPADTLLRRPSIANTHIITAPIINDLPSIAEASDRNSATSSSIHECHTPSPPPPIAPPTSHYEIEPLQATDSSALSPSPTPLSPRSDSSALEAVISHPDEMEHLDQYLVLGDYERKDSHQVNLKANQLVYVIEKHDTGWWMVMSDDEQGYAPASYLEPVEGKTSLEEHMEEGTGQVYEAMESYFAENDDEITIKAGDRIEVISKSMDGWWMIRCNGRTGLSPAALIRRRPSSTADDEELDVYESEKDIYEGLNIHRPPPRRNTIGQSKTMGIPSHYDMPRPKSDLKSTKTNKKTSSKTNSSNSISSSSRTSSMEDRAGLVGSLTSSAVEFGDRAEHVYESQTSEPIYESTDLDENDLPPPTSGSIYMNTEFVSNSVRRKASSPPLTQDKAPSKPAVPSRHAARHKSASEQPKSRRRPTHSRDDYEDPDIIMDGDYIDMDNQDNMYIDPEDLRKGNIDSSTNSPDGNLSPMEAHQNGVGRGDGQLFDDDYIEMDPLYEEPPEEDVDGGTLKASNNVKVSPKQSPVSKRPLPPPPYASSPTPGGSRNPLSRAKSLEDIIAVFSPKEQQQGKSPKKPAETKKMAPNPPPRVPGANPNPQLSQSTSPTVESPKLSMVKQSARKLLPNKKKESESTHEKVTAVKSSNISQEVASFSQRGSPARSPHPPLNHTQSTPSMDVSLPKTYVSIASYSSPAQECLSFSKGDKCVLIQSSPDGWWLVNIGGREGWTPGEYWKEDIREITRPKPPSFAAPRKEALNKKTRSQTVSDVLSTSMDLPSLRTHPVEAAAAEDDGRGFHKSMDVMLTSPTKATPSSMTTNSTVNKLRLKGPVKQISDPRPLKPHKPIVPSKPAVPSKPSNIKLSPRGSPTPHSPPTNRKKHGVPGHTPSPPPQPTGSSEGMDSRCAHGNMAVNGHSRSIARDPSPIADYEQFDEVSLIEGAPWYCGKMERTQAEQYLMDHGRQREFLIRERTSKTGYYALSVRYHFSCKHFNIDPSPEGQYVMGVLTFPSIEHIILHYQQNSLFIHDGQHVTLSQPVKKRPRPSESSRNNH